MLSLSCINSQPLPAAKQVVRTLEKNRPDCIRCGGDTRPAVCAKRSPGEVRAAGSASGVTVGQIRHVRVLRYFTRRDLS
jgi:hypothetical protein